MASSNPNVEALRNAYERWTQSRGRSVEDWVALASPDFQIRSSADAHAEASFGAAPAGIEGLKAYLTDLVNHWIMESYEVEQLIADGDDVVAINRIAFRHRQTNKRVACPLVDVWTFRDGKATSVMEVFDTAAMIQAATPEAEVV